MKKCDTNCNWIERSELEIQLKSSFSKIESQDIALFLTKYIQMYQDIYDFSQLQSAFEYLELIQEFDKEEITDQYDEAIKEIEYGMGEYFISLNEISVMIYNG